MLDTDDIDDQGIARFRALYIHRASEWVNEGEIQRPERF